MAVKYLNDYKGGDGGVIIGDGTAFFNSGDEIRMRGGEYYPYIYIDNLQGNGAEAVYIVNEAGVAQVGGGFDLPNSKFVKILGNRDSNVQYGIKVGVSNWQGSSGVAFHFYKYSSDCEVGHVEVDGAGYGCWIKNEGFCDSGLSSHVLERFVFRDFKFRNLEHHGFYAGATEQNNVSRPVTCNGNVIYPQPSRLGNIKIYNGDIRNIGKNGVMLSDARVGISEIYNMVVRNTGLQTQPDQGSGISLGGYTNAKVWNFDLEDIWLWGIVTYGNGDVEISNGRINGTGRNSLNTLGWPPNISIAGATESGRLSKFRIRNVTLQDKPAEAAHIAVYGSQFSDDCEITGFGAASLYIDPVAPDDNWLVQSSPVNPMYLNGKQGLMLI